MKDGVFIVNTARRRIIDENALIAALESGKVARADLDIFQDEPKINLILMVTIGVLFSRIGVG
jgi:lactate dehydrogenase-like 2-hydroxyacid dehydrogenase